MCMFVGDEGGVKGALDAERSSYSPDRASHSCGWSLVSIPFTPCRPVFSLWATDSLAFCLLKSLPIRIFVPLGSEGPLRNFPPTGTTLLCLDAGGQEVVLVPES